MINSDEFEMSFVEVSIIAMLLHASSNESQVKCLYGVELNNINSQGKFKTIFKRQKF